MQNGIGILYGTIKHNVATVPAWGDMIGKFPDFTPKYWIPLTLFDLSGEIIMSATVNKAGEIRVYRPDSAKFNAVKEYHFYTAYFG